LIINNIGYTILLYEMMSAFADTGSSVSSAQGPVMDATAPFKENDRVFREKVLTFVLAIFETDELPDKHSDYKSKLEDLLEFLQCALHLSLTSELTENLEAFATGIIGTTDSKTDLRLHPVYRSALVATILLQYPAAKRSGRFFDKQLMLAEYPEECAGLSDADVEDLLCYRNYMMTANEVFRLGNGSNQQLFVDVVAYVSQGVKKRKGSQQELKTGKTQSPGITKRQKIFMKESERLNDIRP
jgi:hypothetical protein